MAIRVFELARELGVTSKQIMDKCRAEEIELKNHMAVLGAGLEATIREWFSEGAVGTAVETTEHVDLDKAREVAKKSRRRRKAPAAEAPPAPEAEPPAGETPPGAEPAPAVEEGAPAEPPSVEPVAAEAPAEQPAAEAQPPVPHAPAAEEHPRTHHRKRREDEPPDSLPPLRREVIKPAGPQLVPKPARLKGPTVIRVEKPDFVRIPPPRSSPGVIEPAGIAGIGAAKKKIGAVGEEEEEGKKGKAKRSPRRRTGRSADSGEGLKEWRDRDLAERSARLAAATGGILRRHRASVSQKHESGPTIRAGMVEIEEPITIKNLSAATGIKSADMIRKLMGQGVLATANQVLERSQAELLALEYGVELMVVKAKTAEEELIAELQAKPKGELVTRAPVVTFLGHVDHGKTSLMDKIRQTSVAAGEAGGITQHIGAYRCDIGESHVVFLDTPGHEAFTAMRARGANMTDVVVLVVAADDGVMPQTVEAISHAKAAKVPIIVAMNKIDMPAANEPRVLGQLAEQGLNPREWGGTVEVIRTSAITGQGVEDLVTTLSLEAQLLELKACPSAPAQGYVIEAKKDPGMGVLARLLVRDGTLKVGDVLLAGQGYGRVRQILDDRGRSLTEALPSTPVEVAGLDEMPEAGDRFYIVEDLEQARTVAEDRRNADRIKAIQPSQQITLENLFNKIESGQVTELPLIIKSDVQGSLEALLASINKLSGTEVRVNILHAAVGGISTGDVSLAEASNAIIIGFNVVADSSARQMAEAKGVDIRLYRIIYDVIDDIRKALEEGLKPEIRQETIGRAEVRQTFKVSRVGTIAGCYVTDGLAARNAMVRITRNNVVLEDARTLESLKRFKEDAREVRAGFECGLKIAGYDDIKEGDILEFYRKVEVARTL